MSTEDREDRPLDKTGFPIVDGARVHVAPRTTSMSEFPVSSFGGIVVESYKHEKHGWVLHVREIGSWARRDVKALLARVQTGAGTENQRLDQEIFEALARKASPRRTA